MPDIVIMCPTTKRVVPTGLTTEKIKLDSLSGMDFKLQCPACKRIHRWRSKHAWEYKEEPKCETWTASCVDGQHGPRRR
jgi:hypothetical protein